MAGALAGTLLIDIAANTAKLTKGFSEAQGALTQFGKSIDQVGNLFKQAMAAFGVQQVVGQIHQLVDEVGAIGEKADTVALSTDTFQAFSAALRDAGVNAEATAALLGKAAKTVGDALEGNKQQVEFFQRLNVGLIDAKGNAASMEDVMQRTAQAILKIEDPATRVALASQFMGKSGREAIPALEALAKGGAALREQFQKEIIPKEVIDRFDRFGDRVGTMKAQFKAEAAIAINDFFTPALMTELERLVTNIGNLFKALFSIFADNGQASATLTEKLQGVNNELETLNNWFNTVGQNETIRTALRAITLEVMNLNQATADGIGFLRGLFKAANAQEFHDLAQHIRDQMEIIRGATAELEGMPKPAPAEGGLVIDMNRPNKPDKPNPFTGFPTVKGGGGVDKYAEAMRKLREETKATQDAIDEFNRLTEAGTAGKEAARQAKLIEDIGKARSKVLTDIPKGVDPKPLQDMAEALVRLKFNLDELKRSQEVADGVHKEFGDGTRELKDRLDELNLAYAEGRIKVDEYKAAVKDAQDTQKKQEINLAKQKDGIAGFAGGVKNAMIAIEESTSAFAMGQKAIMGTWQLMSDAISEFVQTGEFNFKKLAAGFAKMLADMVAEWLAAQLILGAIKLGVSAFGGVSNPGSGTINMAPAPSSFGMRASGGPVLPGRSYLVGERGPEAFVPTSAGRVEPNASNGGGITVNVEMRKAEGARDASAALEFGRRVKAAVATVIEDEKRPGGSLYAI